VGGTGDSLDIPYYYLVEQVINFTAERTVFANVGYVNLLKMRDKPWMNGRVRRVNLRRDWALTEHDMTHIGITDATFVRYDYTTHGLHLNSRGRRKLMHLIAETTSGGHASRVGSIPAIAHAILA
jgi:hypothetical protein